MEDYGIKISQNGYDVETCPDDKLVFSSKFDTPKVVGTVTAKFTIGANATASPWLDVSLPDGYVGTRPYGIGFVNLNGKRWRTNVNRSEVSDYLDCYIYTSYVDTETVNGLPILSVRIVRDASSTTYPAAYSTTLKFFIMI